MVEKKKNTPKGLTWGWVLGILFGIVGLSYITNGSTIQGGLLIIASLILLPPINKLIKEKFNFEFSKKLKIILIIIIFVLFYVAYALSISYIPSDNTTGQPAENVNQEPAPNNPPAKECNPDWQCSSWSECSEDSKQTRTCSDKNNCGTNSGQPPISQSCEYIVEDKATMGEKNALGKALSYLSLMPFSYSGLIEQLEFEGYTHEEAVYGADNCEADWNEQAALKAQSYLDIMQFSREGLIEQLEFEGFTKEQAEYGVEAVGY